MTIRSHVLPRVGDEATQKALDLVRAEHAKLPRIPLISGLLLEAVELTTTSVPVAHKLGRKARGYILVGHNIATTFQIYKTQAHDENYLYLASTATVEADLWVF